MKGKTRVALLIGAAVAPAAALGVSATARHVVRRARGALQGRIARDRFLATLSHELRTPLAPVLAGISLLQKDQTLSAQAQQHLGVVRRNVELQAWLLDDLLDFARLAHGKVELHRAPVDICTIIDRAIEVCRSDIEARRLHFAFDRGPAFPYVIEADAIRLQQVFWNLLKNSTKFTPEGGCVGIRCVPDDGSVVVEVSDSGAGIASPDLARIFDAFVQAQRSVTGGLGLGLAISKALIESHGGRIDVHSDGPDEGAIFRVRLPMASAGRRPGPDGREASSMVPDHPARRLLRILVVEDHGDTADMIVEMLQLDGHAVQSARDVTTAREFCTRSTFDVLVSDLGLPDGTGLDLMRHLRSGGHVMPAIALSGYGMERDIRQSRAAGFDAHIVKPVDVDRLLQTIHAVIAARA
jgi:two-component system CheB/CheR fusion protein